MQLINQFGKRDCVLVTIGMLAGATRNECYKVAREMFQISDSGKGTAFDWMEMLNLRFGSGRETHMKERIFCGQIAAKLGLKGFLPVTRCMYMPLLDADQASPVLVGRGQISVRLVDIFGTHGHSMAYEDGMIYNGDQAEVRDWNQTLKDYESNWSRIMQFYVNPLTTKEVKRGRQNRKRG